MKLFLISILKISVLFVLCFSLLTVITKKVNDLFYKKYYSNNNTLIIGDSHVKHLNEEIIPHSINLFRGAESYKISYHKLRYFDKINNFENIILAYSYNNFTPLAEYRMTEEYYSTFNIASISSPIDLSRATGTIENVFKVLSQFYISNNRLFKLIKFSLGFDIKLKSEIDVDVDYSSLLKQSTNSNNKTSSRLSIKKRIDKNFFCDKYDYQFISPSASLYFNKIIDYCSEKNKNLILIKMPLHPQFSKKIPPIYSKWHSELTSDVISLSNVTYLDYENLFENKIHYFKDADHVTPAGGIVISNKIIEIIPSI